MGTKKKGLGNAVPRPTAQGTVGEDLLQQMWTKEESGMPEHSEQNDIAVLPVAKKANSNKPKRSGRPPARSDGKELVAKYFKLDTDVVRKMKIFMINRPDIESEAVLVELALKKYLADNKA